MPLIQHDMVDLLQSVIDEAGITLPFNPVCPDGCADDAEVPASTTLITIPTILTTPIVGRLAPLIHVGRVWRNSYEP